MRFCWLLAVMVLLLIYLVKLRDILVNPLPQHFLSLHFHYIFVSIFLQQLFWNWPHFYAIFLFGLILCCGLLLYLEQSVGETYLFLHAYSIKYLFIYTLHLVLSYVLGVQSCPQLRFLNSVVKKNSKHIVHLVDSLCVIIRF